MSFLFGGRTGRDKRLDQQFEARFDPLIKQQGENAGFAGEEARGTLGKADAAIDPSLKFWDRILSGDRNALTTLLGPEIDSIGERSAAEQRSLSEFGARGGRRSERMGEISDRANSDFERLLLSLRPQAAGEMSGLAQLLYGTGIAQLNASTGASGNALQSLLGSRSQNLQERGMRYNAVGNLFNTTVGALI